MTFRKLCAELPELRDLAAKLNARRDKLRADAIHWAHTASIDELIEWALKRSVDNQSNV